MCWKKGYGNFKYGKTYIASSRATVGIGEYRQPADFSIKDEDGDRYPIASEIGTLKKNWEWVE